MGLVWTSFIRRDTVCMNREEQGRYALKNSHSLPLCQEGKEGLPWRELKASCAEVGSRCSVTFPTVASYLPLAMAFPFRDTTPNAALHLPELFLTSFSSVSPLNKGKFLSLEGYSHYQDMVIKGDVQGRSLPHPHGASVYHPSSPGSGSPPGLCFLIRKRGHFSQNLECQSFGGPQLSSSQVLLFYRLETIQ